MKERDLTQSSPQPARGVLRKLPDGVRHERWAVRADLAPWIEHIWSVRWTLEQPFRVQTLPHPSVHLTLEESAWISGPSTAPFSRILQGQGQVLGVKFRPGAFRDWSAASVHRLRDRRVVALEVVAALAASLEVHVDPACPSTLGCAQVQDQLQAHTPELSAETRELNQWMAWIQEDPALARVEQLSERVGLGVRAIQRRFRERVGVSPKWVLKRVRMLRAVEAIKAQRFQDLSELALSLGYADLAHFSRDFKSAIGSPPSAFAFQAD